MAQVKFIYEREKFKDWLALPKKQRDPVKQGDLAKKLGVAEITLCKWKEDPEFMDDVVRLARKRARQHTPFVLDQMRKLIAKGNVRSMKLWLQYVENWSEKTITELGGETKIKIAWDDNDENNKEVTKAWEHLEQYKEEQNIEP